MSLYLTALTRAHSFQLLRYLVPMNAIWTMAAKCRGLFKQPSVKIAAVLSDLPSLNRPQCCCISHECLPEKQLSQQFNLGKSRPPAGYAVISR
jgi:hypothetical protein